MEKLTVRERNGMQTPLREYWIERDGLLPKETRAFEAGYKVGIEYQKLETQVEIDALKLQIKARDAFLRKIGIDPEKIKVDGIDMGIAD